VKVVFVVGTTGSGKSNLGLHLAKKFSGAVVNCDSVQLYQSVDIGSAKPTLKERQEAPHFLFDVVKEGDEITAGQYVKLCEETLKDLSQKFPVVFVVGGTGFYFQSLEKGMFNVGSANEEMRRIVEEELSTPEGARRLYEELKTKDPKAAEKIFPNDHYRLGRAIEMMRVHGKSVSEVRAEFEKDQRPFPYPLLKLGIKLSREKLQPRVKLRTQQMLKDGLVQEVKTLLQRNKPDWAPLMSVGYKETVESLAKTSRDLTASELHELEAEIVQNTLRLAKKQRTWFGRDPQIQWLEPDEWTKAEDLVARFMNAELIVD
jgi:tRNA dimethylallyltransferase